MNFQSDILAPLSHFFYPHICIGCGSDVLPEELYLCADCISNLPRTGFEMHAQNPVEKIFWGRLPLVAATSELYFSKGSIAQNIIHEFKYRGNKEIGLDCGRMMGKSLSGSNHFGGIDAIIPLPLYYKKEKRRGFNQAKILCEGIAEFLKVPVIVNNVTRIISTETQTKKGRIERWENVNESFVVNFPDELAGKHILLVDDVVTTGATMEACGSQILKVPGVRLSIATFAFATS